MKYFLYLSILIFIQTTLATQENWKPKDKLSYVYLTWEKENTSDHITINYHSTEDYDLSQVFYSTTSQDSIVKNYELKQQGESIKIDKLKRAIHRVTLNDLLPDTTYYFIVGDFKTGFSNEFKFKTLPNDDQPIQFITGGDMGAREKVEDMMIQAAATDPDFVAIGGDIAYANGKIKDFAKWDEWLSMYTETMITSDGYLIPMALALGNHEVNFLALDSKDKAPFFFGLFEQGLGNKAYFKKYIGNHSILYFLDSGFINFFGGSQQKWLEQQMQENQNISNQFSIYHVPLYPSHRDYNGIQSQMARSNWLKTFDKFKLDLAFENHDHTFKVSHPLKNGKIDQSGTIYLGDGCWGRNPRKAHSKRWYLEQTSSTVHVWKITASKTGYKYEAIADSGESIYSKSKVNFQ